MSISESENVNVEVTTEPVGTNEQEFKAVEDADQAANDLARKETADKEIQDKLDKENTDKLENNKKEKDDLKVEEKKNIDKATKKAKKEADKKAKDNEKNESKIIEIKFNIQVAFGKQIYKKGEQSKLSQKELNCLSKDWYSII